GVGIDGDPHDSDWCLSLANSDQFTIETWAQFNTLTSGVHVMVGASFVGISWYFGVFGPGTSGVSDSGIVFGFTPSGGGAYVTTHGENLNLQLGVWYHMAVDKDSNGTIRIYLNGVPVGSSTPINSAFDFTTFNDELDIGAIGLFGGNGMDGWLDEMRITKGVARYKTDRGFTPPTAPFPRGVTL